jgi:polyhydroxyalkanoate synthesis regulator phasin
MKDSKITIDDLVKKIDALASSVDVVSKGVGYLAKNLDDLAAITKKGFDRTEGEISRLRKETNKRFDSLERETKAIKLRQENSAYRFEVQDLDKRVSHLEKGLN